MIFILIFANRPGRIYLKLINIFFQVYECWTFWACFDIKPSRNKLLIATWPAD